MISSKIAHLYTREQREEICRWCNDRGLKEGCENCGITQTAPRVNKTQTSESGKNEKTDNR